MSPPHLAPHHRVVASNRSEWLDRLPSCLDSLYSGRHRMEVDAYDRMARLVPADKAVPEPVAPAHRRSRRRDRLNGRLRSISLITASSLSVSRHRCCCCHACSTSPSTAAPACSSRCECIAPLSMLLVSAPKRSARHSDESAPARSRLAAGRPRLTRQRHAYRRLGLIHQTPARRVPRCCSVDPRQDDVAHKILVCEKEAFRASLLSQ